MKAHLRGRATGSGLGFSVAVDVLKIGDRAHGRRHDRVMVTVRLPDGSIEEFQARDLATEDWEQFNPADAFDALCVDASEAIRAEKAL